VLREAHLEEERATDRGHSLLQLDLSWNRQGALAQQQCAMSRLYAHLYNGVERVRRVASKKLRPFFDEASAEPISRQSP
jgi:hypothetical protein